jgi:hypothetical protein
VGDLGPDDAWDRSPDIGPGRGSGAEGQRYNWGTISSFISIPLIIGVGVVLLAAFLVAQRRRQDREPFVLFRSRNFTLMNWVSCRLSVGMLGIFLPLTIYLQSALGFSALKWILVSGPTLFAVGMGWVVLIAETHSTWRDFLAPLSWSAWACAARSRLAIRNRTAPRQLIRDGLVASWLEREPSGEHRLEVCEPAGRQVEPGEERRSHQGRVAGLDHPQDEDLEAGHLGHPVHAHLARGRRRPADRLAQAGNTLVGLAEDPPLHLHRLPGQRGARQAAPPGAARGSRQA